MGQVLAQKIQCSWSMLESMYDFTTGTNGTLSVATKALVTASVYIFGPVGLRCEHQNSNMAVIICKFSSLVAG